MSVCERERGGEREYGCVCVRIYEFVCIENTKIPYVYARLILVEYKVPHARYIKTQNQKNTSYLYPCAQVTLVEEQMHVHAHVQKYIHMYVYVPNDNDVLFLVFWLIEYNISILTVVEENMCVSVRIHKSYLYLICMTNHSEREDLCA